MMNIAIVGCGNISGIYLKNLTTVFSDRVKVRAVCDLDAEKAKKAAETWGIGSILTLEEVLASPEIDTVLNITTPGGHYAICKKVLEAGKNVYVEKPLSLSYAQGKELNEIAREKGLYLGCAPDTFLGAGLQTAIAQIEQGAIGRPISALAFMLCPGHESWHPDPAFYYDFGGGPLFDMGPYYITALVQMMGRVKSVFAYADKSFKTRTITSRPKYGTEIDVKVDTHVNGLLHFENGAIATLVTSFDVIKSTMPCIEVYGTEGSMMVPDPNGFGGSVKVATRENREWQEVPLVSSYSENSRGIGLGEMALAISEKRQALASGDLALHVLEIMEGLITSAHEGREVILESAPAFPAKLDWDVSVGELKTK